MLPVSGGGHRGATSALRVGQGRQSTVFDWFLAMLVKGSRNISVWFEGRSVGAFCIRRTVGGALPSRGRAIAMSSGPGCHMHLPSSKVVRQVSGEGAGDLTLTARRTYRGGPDGRFRIRGGMYHHERPSIEGRPLTRAAHVLHVRVTLVLAIKWLR